MLTLRLRLPGGQSSTLQLSGSSSEGELRERAAALSSLPLESLQLSVGFPPAPLAHASLPESEAPLSDVVVNMDTVTVSDGAASGQASAPAGKKMPKPKKQPTGSSSGSRVHTLSTDGGGGSGGSGGGSGGSARKRSAAPGSAGGGGGAGAKRRAPKALQLGCLRAAPARRHASPPRPPRHPSPRMALGALPPAARRGPWRPDAAGPPSGPPP